MHDTDLAIKLHPWCQQSKAVAWCHAHNIVVQAYSPIVRNKKVEDPTLKHIAQKYGKTTAQILIRYALQKNWVPLPKSDDPARMRENASVFEFEIAEEDMKALNALEQGPAGAMDEDAYAVADMEIPT
jgi:diketogulonate reductase-like aldo/keto reductase